MYLCTYDEILLLYDLVAGNVMLWDIKKYMIMSDYTILKEKKEKKEDKAIENIVDGTSLSLLLLIPFLFISFLYVFFFVS